MSAPTPETTASSIETLDQLSQADLLKRREKIDTQLDSYEVELNDHFTKLEELNDPQLDIIDQLQMDEESDTSQTDQMSTYSYMIEHGEGLLSPDLLDTFKKIEELDVTEDKIIAQLDARFAPGLMQYARDEAMELYSTIDYVEAGKHERGKSPDLPNNDGIRLRATEQTLPHPDEVIGTLRDIAYKEHSDLDYRLAELQIDEVERCKEILGRWGVGTVKPWPKSVNDHTELERAEELNNRYRHYHNEWSAISAESMPLLPMHEWAVNLPEEEITKYYEHLASIDIDKELERVKIAGTELLPFDFSDSEMRDYIRSNIPAIALEGITGITFRKTSEKEKADLVDNKLFDGKGVLAGHHSHDLSKNNSEIVIHIDPIQDFFDKYSDNFPKEDVVNWTKSEMLDTVAHELGHALHHTLPVNILHEWDEVTANENADVSAYVSEMKKTENDNRFMEDFADSFKLYANMSFELKLKAPERYKIMQSLVTKLKPTA